MLARCKGEEKNHLNLPPSLTITLPGHGLRPEREYSVRMLLHEFLGLDYVVNYHQQPEYILQAEGAGQLVINDSFFALYHRPEDYLKPEIVPGKVSFMKVDEWQKDLNIIESRIPEMTKFKGSLAESPKNLLATLENMYSIYKNYSKLASYSSRLKDQDLGNSTNSSLAQQTSSLGTKISEAISVIAIP